ncbi:MAG: hypothetical protein KF864_04125 [Phycisphaeraceae bacterium]|nr:hypothetical protein [Phycisphaeraceae bacterium]MBX3409621.1 hypothetical protein [Phycisphaeraceae bacterium]
MPTPLPELCAPLLAAVPAAVNLPWRPFIDPIDVHRAWYLLIVPLALGISIVYKAVRVGDMRQYPRQVAVMTVQIIGAMALLGLASYLLIEHIVPAIFPAR